MFCRHMSGTTPGCCPHCEQDICSKTLARWLEERVLNAETTTPPPLALALPLAPLVLVLPWTRWDDDDDEGGGMSAPSWLLLPAGAAPPPPPAPPTLLRSSLVSRGAFFSTSRRSGWKWAMNSRYIRTRLRCGERYRGGARWSSCPTLKGA
jgi:hypothetical protein